MSDEFRVSKTFHDFPCAHRAHNHGGRCRQVHGYCRSFTLFFACGKLDENGFVIDLSNLKIAENWLRNKFDHTIILAHTDPLIDQFRKLQEFGAMTITAINDVSSEGIAKYISHHILSFINEGIPDVSKECVVLGTGNTVNQNDPAVNNSITDATRIITLCAIEVTENDKISARMVL